MLGPLLFLEAAALAQPALEAQPAPAPAAAVGEQDMVARRAEALTYFEKGLAFFEKEIWDAALAEFVRSRATYSTRTATMNAAACLRNLRRFDEAFDMFEEVLKFPNLPTKDREVVEQEITGLQGRVGTLVVEVTEPGASLVIDGRYRGTLPLASPLRVGVGSHVVRAYKEGLDPFGATVEVTGKQQVVVQLRSLSTRGRLKVSEQHGWTLDVVIDETVVGKTPWEGSIAVGEHLVRLRGAVNLGAVPKCVPNREGASSGQPAATSSTIELGTEPVSVPVLPREVTKLALTAEEFEASMRIEPTPAGATVAIDCVIVGRGTWEGRLLVGAHTVEITADGFLSETRQVNLAYRKRQVVTIKLESDWSTPGWRTARSAALGAAYGIGALGLGVFGVTGGMALSKVNEVTARCGGTQCPASERANVNTAESLGKVATVGLVVGGIGVVAGTIVLLATRPVGSPRRSGIASTRPQHADRWGFRAGMGLGRLEIEGRF